MAGSSRPEASTTVDPRPDAAERRREPAAGAGVLVTGVAGRLGRALTRRLHRSRHVIGVDVRPFVERPKDVEHFQLDLRRKRARDVFRRRDIGALVHLGVVHNPRHSGRDHYDFNVVGFQNLINYALHFGIPKLVLLSSANVYGPRPDNPQFLDEDAPLLGAGPFSEIRDLVELDMLAQSALYKHPELELVILRPAHILGTVHNAPSNYLRLRVVPTLLGFDPMVQVVHQEDLVGAIELCLAPGVRGIYNVAGPPPVPLSQALRVLGRTALPVPHTLAKLGVDRLFRMHVTSFPAPELDFIRYVCMVDDGRARRQLGYQPRFELSQTLHAVDRERWI